MATRDDQPCAVYRHFDSADHLLYIGSSINPEVRWFHGHMRHAEWAGRAVRRTDEWYESVPEARAAEIVAILAEHPEYNRRHVKLDVKPKPAVHYRQISFRPPDWLAKQLTEYQRIEHRRSANEAITVLVSGELELWRLSKLPRAERATGHPANDRPKGALA